MEIVRSTRALQKYECLLFGGKVASCSLKPFAAYIGSHKAIIATIIVTKIVFETAVDDGICDQTILQLNSFPEFIVCSSFLDMDDTLYPMSAGLNFACRKNIEEFMSTYLNIEESQVPDMCLDLYREHGTTMAGLKALGYEFDNNEYHALVHGTLPYHALKPDLVLRTLLMSMPQRKIIFTNADKAHAAQVLKRMCLEDCFEGVICFETLNNHPLDNKNDGGMNNRSNESVNRIICKPALESFQAAMVVANIDPNQTIFFDDSVRNIATAKAAGFHTVIVGRSSLVPGADHALSSIHNIKEALPELWDDEEHLKQVFFPSASVETVVNA